MKAILQKIEMLKDTLSIRINELSNEITTASKLDFQFELKVLRHEKEYLSIYLAKVSEILKDFTENIKTNT